MAITVVVLFKGAPNLRDTRAEPEWESPEVTERAQSSQASSFFNCWRDHLTFLDTFSGGLNTPIGCMFGIYANIGGILMVNVTISSIHGSYGTYDET